MAKKIDEQLIEVSHEIERLCNSYQIDIVDACVLYSEQTGMEIETVGDIIAKNQRLRARVQKHAEDNNFLKKTNRLPVC